VSTATLTGSSTVSNGQASKALVDHRPCDRRWRLGGGPGIPCASVGAFSMAAEVWHPAGEWSPRACHRTLVVTTGMVKPARDGQTVSVPNFIAHLLQTVWIVTLSITNIYPQRDGNGSISPADTFNR
jgi:hypothetical protein